MNPITQFFKELFQFLKENKWWWIIPLIIFAILIGLIIFFSLNAKPIPVFVYNIPG